MDKKLLGVIVGVAIIIGIITYVSIPNFEIVSPQKTNEKV
jgi:hypothetical protein